MRTPLIAGNWKMHGSNAFVAGYAASLAGVPAVAGVDVLLLPPAAYVAPLAQALAGHPARFGVQNVHPEPEGAYTGEISAEMARDLGAQWALVGHSERRTLFGETDEQVAAKVAALLRAGLRPIVCVGETLAERDAGSADAVVRRQLDAGVAACGGAADRLTVAYEPVWAIGTGRTASPAEAQDMHAAIRTRLTDLVGAGTAGTIRILYGGSVKPDNAAALLAQVDVDGALVGGASLDPTAFTAIIAAGAGVPAAPAR